MGFIIQFSSLVLMFLQSIITPYIIGLDNYGSIVVYMLPLLFFTAILESFYAIILASNESKGLLALSTMVITVLFIINYFYIDDFFYLVLFNLLTFFFVLSFSFKSIFYEQRKYTQIAIVEVMSVLFYGITLVYFVFDGNSSREVYIYALLAYSVISFSIYIIYIDKSYLVLKSCFNGFVIENFLVSLSWKSYHLYINIFLLYFVSIFYSSSFVASLKIIFSVSYIIRFVAPFTLPMFYNLTRDSYYIAKKKISYLLVFSSSVSVIMFYIGKYLSDNISFINDFDFMFDDIRIIIAYPLVVFSVYIGTFFVVLKKALLFFLITTLSFVFILVGIYTKYTGFGSVFLLGVLFYQFLAMFFIFYFQHDRKLLSN